MWGELAGLSVADILNFAHEGRRTGLLIVRAGSHQWALGFREGELVLARSTSAGTESPRDICLALLRHEEGAFLFLRGPLYAFRSVEAGDVRQILLDGSISQAA